MSEPLRAVGAPPAAPAGGPRLPGRAVRGASVHEHPTRRPWQRSRQRGRSRVRPWVAALRQPVSVAGLALITVTVAVGVLADVLAPHDPFKIVAPALQPPSRAFPMGTDNLGRDLYSAVIHGTRTSLLVTAAVVAIASLVGIAVGLLCGYFRGIVDDGLMRVTELFQAVPRFFLALLVVALFGSGLYPLILLLGFTSWPLLSRVVRAQALSEASRPYVEAAVAAGARSTRVLWRHVLPNVLPPALSVVALLASRVILIEAGLSFLGLGDASRVSWGQLASSAQPFLHVAWWMSVFPGTALTLAVVGLQLTGDAFTNALGARGGRLIGW